MSRWTIYDKDGNALHESIVEYDGKGKVVYQDTFEYVGKWMGECYLTVSIKSPYPIDFQIGDYIIYRGEKFTINYDPTVVKKSSRGTYGEGFVYDSVKFNALSNELTDVKFHDWVLSDNHVHYSSLPNFSFYAKDMNDLADRLQACMDRWCKDNGFAKEDYWIFYTPGSDGDTNPYDRTLTRAKDISTDETFLGNVLTRWKSIYGDGGTLVERADELVDKNVQINNQTVWQGMALFKSDFGLNFIIRGREVIVGAAGTIASHIFKYGKGNGLYEVEKQADTDQKVVTRLHAYGSSDNLPTRYYAELDMKVFANVTSVEKGKDFFRIGLDMDYKPGMFTQKMSKYGDDIFAIKVMLGETEINARIEGHDDKNKARIYSEYLSTSTDPDDNTDKEVYDAFYNALADGSKIYITGGVNKDLAPAGHIDYSANRLPDNMAINNLMLPGFPKYALSDLCKSEYDEKGDSTHYYIRKNKESSDWVLFHSEAGNHVVRFSENQYDPYIISPNADKLGYKDDDIFCTEENDDNGLKKVYPSVEEITEAEAGVSTDDKTYINTIVSADIIKDNGVYPKKTGTSVPGFQVVIKNLGFDLQDAIAAAGGESCKLSMKDGHCGGRDFDVPSVAPNSDGTWTLNCKRSPDSSLDLYYPYSYNMSIGGTASAIEPYQICAGDHFVLTGIAMEATNYVWAASVKLLRKAIHWLCKNDYSRYTYSPKIDEIYMARQDQEAQKSEGKTKSLHDTLKEGDLLWFQDEDLLLDGKVYIDQLIIKENGNNGIPTYDVTLRNEVQVGTIQRIQNKVDSIANDVKSGNVGGAMSASSVENIVNAVGDDKYLRKDKDDETTHKLTMGAAEVKGDATVGGDSETAGKSTVGGDADVKKNATIGKDLDVKGDAKVAGSLTTSNLTVTDTAHFFNLQVDKITAGSAGRISSAADGFTIDDVESMGGSTIRVFWLAQDSKGKAVMNMWRKLDQAICQSFNLGQISSDGTGQEVSNKFFWCLVTDVSGTTPVERTVNGVTGKYNWIDLSTETKAEGCTVNPAVGDDIAQLGHRGSDTSRQNANYESSYVSIDPDLTPPLVAAYRGITDFDLSSHRKSYHDAHGGKWYGDLQVLDDVEDTLRLTQQHNGLVTQTEPDSVSIHVADGYGRDATGLYKFDVERTSGDATADAQWNMNHKNVTSPLSIAVDDLTLSVISSAIIFNFIATHKSGSGKTLTGAVTERLDSTRKMEIYFVVSNPFPYVRSVDVEITARLRYGDDDYSYLLQASDTVMSWSRDSGIEAEDKAWVPTLGATKNILEVHHHIPDDGQRKDCGLNWAKRKTVAFTFSATVQLGGQPLTLEPKTVSIGN